MFNIVWKFCVVFAMHALLSLLVFLGDITVVSELIVFTQCLGTSINL